MLLFLEFGTDWDNNAFFIIIVIICYLLVFELVSEHALNSWLDEEETNHAFLGGVCFWAQVTKVTIPELPLVDVKNARFPYCLVWTPLPVIAWLVPFVGHVGICREDGIILDYGITSNVNINRLEFGSTAKYVRLHPYQVICYYYYYFLFLLFLFLLHRLNKNVLAVATYTILNISLWNVTPDSS